VLELMQVVRGEAVDKVFTPEKVELALDRGTIRIEPLAVIYTDDRRLGEMLSTYLSDGEITMICQQIRQTREKTKQVAVILAKQAIQRGEMPDPKRILQDIKDGRINLDAVVAEHQAQKAEAEKIQDGETTPQL
jgi:K+/H+ antiporter YhaU regulatory subunit KhtT